MSDKIIKTPHNNFFKAMMHEPKVIREFFECNLPAHIKSVVDLDTIKLEKDSFVSDDLDERFSDLVVSVEFNKKPGYIVTLVEHQTEPERMMPFRVLKYMVAIFDHHVKATKNNKNKSLPVVYPLIFYTGERKYNYSTCLFDLFGANNKLAKDILCSPYKLINVSQIPDEELMLQPWYGMFAIVMKHAHDREAIKYLGQITKALEPLAKIEGIDYIYKVLRYIMSTYNVDKKHFMETVKTNLPFIDEAKIMTILEQSRQEGRQEGKQEGRQEGSQEASEAIAFNLLRGNKLTDTEVIEYTGLSLSDIEKLKRKIITTH